MYGHAGVSICGTQRQAWLCVISCCAVAPKKNRGHLPTQFQHAAALNMGFAQDEAEHETSLQLCSSISIS
jgi:hypothetical protein